MENIKKINFDKEFGNPLQLDNYYISNLEVGMSIEVLTGTNEWENKTIKKITSKYVWLSAVGFHGNNERIGKTTLKKHSPFLFRKSI